MVSPVWNTTHCLKYTTQVNSVGTYSTFHPKTVVQEKHNRNGLWADNYIQIQPTINVHNKCGILEIYLLVNLLLVKDNVLISSVRPCAELHK